MENNRHLPYKRALRLARHRAVFFRETVNGMIAQTDWNSMLRQIVHSAVPELGDLCLLRAERVGAKIDTARSSNDPGAAFDERLFDRLPRLISPHDEPRERWLLPDDSAEVRRFLRATRMRGGWVASLSVRGQHWATLVGLTRRRKPGFGLPLVRLYARMASGALEGMGRYSQSLRTIQGRDDFLVSASHELRTPITTLRILSHSLRKVLRASQLPAPISGAALPLADRFENQILRLEGLVTALLEGARANSGEALLTLRRTDLTPLIRRTVERHRSELELAGCAVELRLDGAIEGVWDEARLEQLVSNLLQNAAKYGRGKPISVRAWRDGADAKFSVRDEGIGIAPEEQGRIFERFERGVSPLEYSGFGLGLSVSRWIVESHRGEISVRSLPGHGAVFTVRLPLERGREAGRGSADQAAADHLH